MSQGFVADMGRPGPDKGAGGKYLIVPPGYDAWWPLNPKPQTLNPKP